jgi:hypothetical protein
VASGRQVVLAPVVLAPQEELVLAPEEAHSLDRWFRALDDGIVSTWR